MKYYSFPISFVNSVIAAISDIQTGQAALYTTICSIDKTMCSLAIGAALGNANGTRPVYIMAVGY